MSERNRAVEEDLAALSNATNYRTWMFSLVRPYLGSRILEVGSGIGNYSTFLLDRERVWLSDYDREYVQGLKEKFNTHPNVSFHLLDLARLDETVLSQMQSEGLDTILAMNVLEHISDDESAIRTLVRYLSRGGRIILTVPALSFLYGSLDKAYGHYRRYDRADARRLLVQTELHLRCARYFNIAAIVGWYWISKVRDRDRLPRRTVDLYDKVVVPIMATLERIFTVPVGSSMLIVLERPGNG